MYARANGSLLTVASSDGQVVTIDAAAGKELWRAKVSGPLGAGVGSDGRLVALLTRGNELLALQDGREI
ncbi:MAG: outer membrane protein assembly factor BamB, partial [Betaproteobacteria bacterium]|nr:outer membrane protein assembly factor BamB [Betaproteobacteria bacterium]